MGKIKKAKAKIHSNEIKTRLKELEMTQQELADEIGTTKEHISRIINSKKGCVSLVMAMKISKYLKHPIEKLFILEKNGKEKAKTN